MLLIKVENVKGKKIMFLANVGEGFLYKFLDEPPLVDMPNSGHCPKKSVGHYDAEPLGLLWTEDGKNKLNYPTLPRVLTIHRMEPVLRVMLCSEVSYEESMFAANPPFSLPLRKPVYFRPYLGRPLLRIMPYRLEPLIPNSCNVASLR